MPDSAAAHELRPMPSPQTDDGGPSIARDRGSPPHLLGRGRGRGQTERTTCSGRTPWSRSFSISWNASTKRIVPDAERSTMEWV